tara:strand:- start:241 stop:855 length:615 start_codon:yes stop_codon:yes gene_type:complete
MALYTKDGIYPKSLPFRIILSNGKTRTDPSTFAAAEIADAGYIEVADEPVYDPNTQNLNWDSNTLQWSVTNKTKSTLDNELRDLQLTAKDDILAARSVKMKEPFYSVDVGNQISRKSDDMIFTLTSIITSILATRKGTPTNVPIIDVNDRVVLLNDQAVENVTTELFQANRADLLAYRDTLNNLRKANTASEISNIVTTYTMGA